MKKTYIYIIVAVVVLVVIAVLVAPQIMKKTPSQPEVDQAQILEAEGLMQLEGKELNALKIDPVDLQEIDTEIEKL
jgi:hypothetical protein